MDLKTHLTRQAAFSRATFGPGARTEGVLDHIASEANEVRAAENFNERSKEWVDIVILGLDGLMRSLQDEMTNDNVGPIPWPLIAEWACEMIEAKQAKNELRDWPDWRAISENKRIEHIKSGDLPKEE